MSIRGKPDPSRRTLVIDGTQKVYVGRNGSLAIDVSEILTSPEVAADFNKLHEYMEENNLASAATPKAAAK